MNRNRAQTVFLSTVATLSLLLFMGTTCLVVQAATPPSIPPCAPDGVCHPSHPWGRTPTRWRKWPGVDSSTSDAGGEIPIQVPIGPTVKPGPAEEDTEAPPMIDAIEPPSEDAGGGFDLPPMGEIETPQPEGGPPRPPAGGGLPFGPPEGGAPPTLPFGDPAPAPDADGAQPGGAAPQPPAFQFNQNLPGVYRDNAPPQLPVIFREPATVTQASVGQAPAQFAPAPAPSVRPASVDAANLPPALPAIFFKDVE